MMEPRLRIHLISVAMNATAKANAVSWKGGTRPVIVVSSASVAHIRIALAPITVARPTELLPAASGRGEVTRKTPGCFFPD